MSGSPSECRALARDCLRIAETAPHPIITRAFVDLAHSWTKLAIDLESAQALVASMDELDEIPAFETRTTPIVSRN